MRSLSRPIYRVLIIAALFVSGCATPFVAPEHVSSVSVTFVEPEKFTDVRRTEWEHNSHGLLAALAKFMQETGERALPPEMQLYDQSHGRQTGRRLRAWFRGAQSIRVRIIKEHLSAAHRPRVSYLSTITAGSIKAGKRELTDIDYQRRGRSRLREDYLRYEKDILRDWLRAEFSDLKNRTVG